MPLNEYEETLVQDEPDNPYRETLRLQEQSSEVRLRQAVQQSVDKDPQRQAEILGLSQRTGLPAPVIDRNFDAIKKRSQITDTDYSRMLQESPKLSSWVTDPENMALAKDDLPQLGMVEKAVTTLSDYAGSLASGAAAGIGSFAHGLSESIGIGGRMLRRAIENQITIDQSGIHITPSPYHVEQFGTAIPGAAEATQVALQEAAQAWNEMSQSAATPPERQTFGTQLASSVGQLVPILAAAYVAPEAVGPMLVAQGMSQVSDMVETDKASTLRKDVATLAGGAVMATAGRFGLSQLLERVPLPVQNVVLKSLVDVTTAGGIQAADQFTMDLMNGVARKVLTNPQAAILPQNELENLALAFGTGATVRTALQPVLALQARAQAKTQEQLITALTHGVTDSKTLERFPPKLQEFLREATKDGPVPNLYIPVEKWNEYFQSQKQDPARAAADAGIDRAAYEQAMATGSDLQVPTADYFTKVAPEHGAAFVKEIRLHPEQMNAREAEAYATALEKEPGAATPPPTGPEASAAQVREDIIGQMIDRGFDRTAVEAYAGLYQSAFRTMGERAGVDPFQLYEPYRLKVTRPIPEILQSLGRVDALDSALDRLRSGDVPQQREIFGPSLIEFLREKGGVVDAGGELKALEVDAGRKAFEKKLVQKGGLPLDRAREAAAEAGYIPKGGSVAEFLDTIDKEARGQPVYSQQAADPRKLEQTTMLQQLGDYLKAVGVDLKTASNAEVKEILNQAAIEPKSGQVLNQAAVAQPARIAAPPDAASQALMDRASGYVRDQYTLRSGESTSLFIGPDGHLVDIGEQTHAQALDKAGLIQKGATPMAGMEESLRQNRLVRVHVYGRELAFHMMHEPTGPQLEQIQRLVNQRPEGIGYDVRLPDGRVAQGHTARPQTFWDAVLGTKGYEQQVAEEKRGAIRFGANRQFNIELFEKADLSTFLHESGHFFLEVFGDTVDELLARSGDLEATQQKMIEDYGGLLKHLGVQDRSMIGTEQHEEFARTFEAYLREGKAPSAELRSVFSRFRAWLVSIYRSLQQLNVKLTPEVTGVMDRLLATDQEIDFAQQQAGIEAMFTDAQQAGMSEAEFKAYRETVQQASDRAKDKLQRQVMDEYQRTRENWWQAERERTRDEVAREVHQQPEYVALAFLQKGTLPDGSPLPEGLEAAKLSKDSIVELRGKEFLKRLPRPYVYARDGGIPVDAAAELLGFASGDELLDKIANARPMDPLIDAETDSRMRDRHGDMLLDGSIADKARDFVMTAGRSEVLAAELRALAKKKKEVAPFLEAGKQRTREGVGMLESTPPVSVVRNWAETRVAGMRVRDLQPNTYWTAARQAGRRALEASAKDDFNTALTEKRKELLNVELYRAATNAREHVAAVSDYLQSFGDKAKRERIGKAGGDYLEQIDGLLEQYEFKQVSLKAIEKRKRLADWIADQQQQGLPVELPADVVHATRQQNYKDLTVEQLQGLSDSVKMIEHLARLKNKLLTAQDQRTFDAAKGDILQRIETTVPEGTRDLRTRANAGGQTLGWARSFAAAHRKMSSFVFELDGLEMGGPFWERFIRPMNDSGNMETQSRQDAGERLDAMVRPILAEGKMGGKGQWFASVNMSLNREERIAIALNTGNDSNLQRLLGGENWTREQIQPVLDTLSKTDWDFVQSVWDFFESYRPDIGKLEKRTVGVEPEWIEPTPVQTPFGEYKGGYYPVKYDPARSARAEAFASAEDAKAMQRAAFTSSTTRRSFTKARVEEVHGRPLLYSFSGIYQGATEIVHDLAWREWLMDANHLLRDHEIDQAVRTRYGPEGVDIFRSGVQDIARGDAPAVTALEKGLNRIRKGATVSGLAWNFFSAAKQLPDVSFAAVRIGKGWVARAIVESLASPLETQRRMNADPFMRERGLTLQRDINDIRGQIGGKTEMREAVEKTFFAFTAAMQRVVDTVAYQAQYNKSMAAGESEDRARALAQQAVLDTQGGGQIKDLAQIQRGHPALKLFTMFYHGFAAQYQITAERTKQAGRVLGSEVGLGRKAGETLSLATDYLLMYGLQAAFGASIAKWFQGDEEPWWKVMSREGLGSLMGLMVGVREAGAAAEKLMGLQQYKRDYAGPAGVRFFGELERTAEQIHQGEWDKGLRKALINLGGMVAQFPAAQTNRTLDGLVALWEGKTKNPAALAFGPPQEKTSAK